MKNDQKKNKELDKKDVLAEYVSQTKKDEDVHFEHIDWTYNDGSCCC